MNKAAWDEAYKRNILSNDEKSLYEEANRRNLWDKEGVSNGSRQSKMPKSSFGEKALVGLGRGFTDVGEGVKQFALERFADKSTLDAYNKQVQEERNLYANTPVGESGVGGAGRFVGNVLPYAPIPTGAGLGLLGRALSGGAVGGLGGGLQFVPEGGSRLNNAAMGAGFGAGANMLIPPAINALGTGANKISNAIRGKFKPETEAVINAGKRWDVPVYAADISPKGSMVQGTQRFSEQVPLINTVPERMAQMNKAQKAAESITNQYRARMISNEFSGPNGFNNLKKVIAGGGPRAKAAQELMDAINASGDDWGKIIQNSGNVKLLEKKLIADRMSNQLSSEADKVGFIDYKNTIKAVNNSIKEIGDKVLPNDSTLSTLSKIRSNLIGKEGVPKQLSFSQLRDFRSDLGSEISDFYKGKNAAIGERGVQYLQSVKSAIERDLEAFGNKNPGSELSKRFTEFNKFYQKELVPYKDAQLAKALKNANPDEVYSMFIKRGQIEGGKGIGRATQFYNALDNKGRAAVKYGMLSNALEKATDKELGNFSPARFASELENLAPGKAAFFKGTDKAEVDGFINLMRHIERSGQMNSPETGYRTIPYLLAGVYGGGAIAGGIPAAIGGAAGAYAFKKGITSKGLRALVAASSKLEAGSPAMQATLTKIFNSLRGLPIPATAITVTRPEDKKDGASR